MEASNVNPRRNVTNAGTSPKYYNRRATACKHSAFSIDRRRPGLLETNEPFALTFWFIPLGNIFIPMALWIYRKNRIQGVRDLGKRILNFQITWTLVTKALPTSV